MSDMKKLMDSLERLCEDQKPLDEAYEYETVVKPVQDRCVNAVSDILKNAGLDEREARDVAEHVFNEGFVKFAKALLRSRGL